MPLIKYKVHIAVKYVLTFLPSTLLNIVNYISFTFRERKDLYVSKCKRHEKSVGDVMVTICSMTNPFNAISSGVEVERKVADNILQAEQNGEHQFSDFVKNNLFRDKPDRFTKIKQNKLKTFSSDSENQ